MQVKINTPEGFKEEAFQKIVSLYNDKGGVSISDVQENTDLTTSVTAKKYLNRFNQELEKTKSNKIMKYLVRDKNGTVIPIVPFKETDKGIVFDYGNSVITKIQIGKDSVEITAEDVYNMRNGDKNATFKGRPVSDILTAVELSL